MIASQITILLGWPFHRSQFYWDGRFTDHNFTGMVVSQITILLGWSPTDVFMCLCVSLQEDQVVP